MSINQLIKPITAQRIDGILYLGGCNSIELADKYGTPLYVLDERSIRNVVNEYKNAFKNYPKVKFMYASKALCTSALVRILDEEGFGFDAVSKGEIFTIYHSGVDMAKILFNGNNKTENEIEYAVQNKVGRFSVDNFYEAEVLNKIAKNNNTIQDILIRITPGIECHTHDYIQTGQTDSKFGFDLSQVDDIVSLIQNNYKNLHIRGLHAHIGSQIFELRSYVDEIEILVNELNRIKNKYNITMDEINIGGGLGVKYTEEDNPPSINEFADSIISAINKIDGDIPTIYLEPGRSVVSAAGVTLYKIGSIKQVPKGRKYVSVDGGMADNPRPGMYQAKYTAEIANAANGRSKEVVTIAGKFCESGDILIKDIEMYAPASGDILCVYNTGSYNYSMSSNYNKAEKPAMVLVNNSQSDIIVNRECLEDLVSHDSIPERLRKNNE